MKGKFLLFALLALGIVIAGLSAERATGVAAASTPENEEAMGELEETIDELIGSLDTEELQKFLDTLSDFGGISVKDKLRDLLTGDFSLDYGNLFDAVLSLLWEEGQKLLPSFAIILAVALLCGILNSAKNSFLHSTISDIIHFVAYISVGAVVLASLISVFEAGYAAIASMKKQMDLVYPLLLTLMAASGGAVSVAIYRPAVAFFGGALASLFSTVILPTTGIVIVLSFVSHLSTEIHIQKLGDFFKSVSRWLLGLTIGIFGVFISVQGITAAQYDGMSLRAIKYVISGSVPFVGGFLSGGVELVIAGSVLIKNALGAFAIILLIGTILRPLLLCIALRLLLHLSAAVTEPVGGNISPFLSKIAQDSGYFLAALLSMAFLYFLTILLLICSTGAFF